MFGVEPATADSGAGPIAPASSGMGAPFWILMIVVLAAIVGAGWYAFSVMNHSGSNITVQVQPPKLQLAPGAKATLSAFVSGDPEANVTWSVMEAPNGGTVHANGVIATGGRLAAAAEYVAPLQPGTYHVLATSAKHTKQASSAEIVVTP